MGRYRLHLSLIITSVLLSGFLEWYEAAHQTHTTGYIAWLPIAVLVGIVTSNSWTKWQETRLAKGRLSGQDFLEKYIALLTNAIAVLQDIHTYDAPQLQETQTKILKLIASVVKLFHPEEELGINANLMQNAPVESHSVNDKFQDHVYFFDPKRAASSYASVLCVIAWGSPPKVAPVNFALPIDTDEQRVLFGAPRTFVSGEKIVIANIHNRKEVNAKLGSHPDVVRDAVHAFFLRQPYKTFMSIAVENADKRIAVLNVQSDKLKVFGNKTRQQEIEKFIAPFCSILGILVAQTQSPIPNAEPK